MSYEDIVEAQKKRDEKEARIAAQVSRKRQGPVKAPTTSHGKSPHRVEAEVAEREIAAAGLSQYCTVLRFT